MSPNRTEREVTGQFIRRSRFMDSCIDRHDSRLIGYVPVVPTAPRDEKSPRQSRDLGPAIRIGFEQHLRSTNLLAGPVEFADHLPTNFTFQMSQTNDILLLHFVTLPGSSSNGSITALISQTQVTLVFFPDKPRHSFLATERRDRKPARRLHSDQ